MKSYASQYNMEMFTSQLCDGKAFAAEQNIRYFKNMLNKSRTSEKSDGKKVNLKKLIKITPNYLSKAKSAKYGFPPGKSESKSINDKNFTKIYDFHRLVKEKEDADRRGRSDKNKNALQMKKLREPLDLGESVFILAVRLRKTHQVNLITAQQKIIPSLIKTKFELLQKYF